MADAAGHDAAIVRRLRLVTAAAIVFALLVLVACAATPADDAPILDLCDLRSGTVTGTLTSTYLPRLPWLVRAAREDMIFLCVTVLAVTGLLSLQPIGRHRWRLRVAVIVAPILLGALGARYHDSMRLLVRPADDADLWVRPLDFQFASRDRTTWSQERQMWITTGSC
ncbi:hypothetical protein T492DRAFT_220468 [Pavlovales sp. CCMP2436]|nr:hypothetical protein T492DRAFT_220468 [Pavlovales sp. CCMP2436]